MTISRKYKRRGLAQHTKQDDNAQDLKIRSILLTLTWKYLNPFTHL